MHHGPGTAQEHNCADGRSAVARLNRRKPVLTQEQLARLVAVAPLPGTWHRKPTAPRNAVALQRGFDASGRRSWEPDDGGWYGRLLSRPVSWSLFSNSR